MLAYIPAPWILWDMEYQKKTWETFGQYDSTDYSLTYGALEHGWIMTFQKQLGLENHPN